MLAGMMVINRRSDGRGKGGQRDGDRLLMAEEMVVEEVVAVEEEMIRVTVMEERMLENVVGVMIVEQTAVGW